MYMICISYVQIYLSPFFLGIGWYCGAGDFGLIGCKSLTPSLALPTFFNKLNPYIIKMKKHCLRL